jgi:hypothetical protein
VKRPLTMLRSLTVTYSKVDLLAVARVGAMVTAWLASAGGGFSVRALLACEAMFFAFYLVGSVLASVRPLAAGLLFELPLRVLVGYGVVNTALMALAWLSPLGVIANFGLVVAPAILAFFSAGSRKHTAGHVASLWVVGLCAIATTLWCQDSIRPTEVQESRVVFKPWVDGFYHAVHVRIFGASHGSESIQDFRLSGVTARPYHYGMYMLPGFVKQASGLDSYTVFAGLLAPVGVFFTGLAAYSFFGSLWGAWPGLSAAAALLLLPDGAQQGMGNTFMSYHWLTQISPSATYGLALLVVAWLFVIQGCARGSRLQLCVGWFGAAVVTTYKLHYVVASALLLLLVPALFYRGALGVRRRAAWVVAACAAYWLALAFGQKVPGVPRIRFDGSSAGEILRLVQDFAKPGAIHDFFSQRMGAHFSSTANLLFGIPYVLLAMLGVFGPLLVLLVVRLRQRVTRLVRFFPLLLIANFLAMFFGLALDFESSTPDELSHRPLLIVYFFVLTWVGGALGLLLLESQRLRRIVGPFAVAMTALLLDVPAHFGAGVQAMWAMPRISPVQIPSSMLRIANYMRDHGRSDDVFQDSQFDRTCVFAALAERRPFVAHTLTRMPFRSEMVEARTNAIDHFMGIRQPKLLTGTARALGFRWFVLERGDVVEWPPEIADHPVLEAGPFRLYEF